ncbi:rho guanine nucleotide exchange factor 5 [Eublepharis macularius]|uniref:Rho guanine nucleotide exchange factor 5 n=1 Tax=Eublepharis macularius TaxID=481883 RepID=A0AA97KK99_EUBMA|nr:rho guanine nucleotide exchange factor 5 [Eublepharis macularius]
MEAEKTKAGDPLPAATTFASEPLDLGPPRGHHEVPDFRNISEEEPEEKAEASFSQDVTLLFVVEEQLWSRLSNPLEREAFKGLQSSHRDPGTRAELSQEESNVSVKETSLEDSFLNFSQGECTAACSSWGHQSSFSGTIPLEQDPKPSCKAAAEQPQDHTIAVGFPQALNFCDTLLQTQYEETSRTDSFPPQEDSVCSDSLVNHGIAKCQQNAESSKSRSDENQSWELQAQWSSNKGLAQEMETTGGSDNEASSMTVRDGGVQPILSADNEEKVIELSGQNDDAKSHASPKCSELSNSRRMNLDAMQAMPSVSSASSPSKTMNSHSDTEKVEDLERESFICNILHLWEEEEEEENPGGDNTHSSLKERIQTRLLKNGANCGESESTQKESEKTKPGTIEVLKLEDTNDEEEEDLDWKEEEDAMETKQETLDLDQKDQDMRAQSISREELQKESPVQSFRSGLETLYNLENDSVFPEYNKNCPLVENDGSTFPFKELFPPDGCPESAFALPELHVQTTKASVVLVSKSPKTQPGTGQWEYSGSCDHTYCVPQSQQDSKKSETGSSENGGDGESIRTFGGEGRALVVQDLAVTPDPQDIYDSQLAHHSIDNESHIPASPLGTMSTTDSVEEDAGKGARDDTVDYAMVEEDANSIPDSLDSCREASVLSSDFSDIQGHRKQTIINKDFQEETRDSVPKSLLLTPPSNSQGLFCVDKESGELNLVSPPQDPESLQAQDADVNYLEKFQQHLKPTVRSFVFPSKEAGEETLCVVQETTLDDPPCLVVLEEDRTECEPSSEIPTSPNTSIATATQALPPVPVLGQTQAHETASIQFGQSSPPTLDCRQPACFVTPPPDANLLAQSPDPDLDSKCPTQPLELLLPSSQNGQLLDRQSTSAEVPAFSAPVLNTEVSVQPLTLEPVPRQPSQLPEQVFNFDCSPSLKYYAKCPMSMPALLQHTNYSVCPASNANQPIQPFVMDSSQIREDTGPKLNASLLPQLPVFDFNTDLHHLPPASISSIPPTSDNNQFAQQSIESGLLLTCLADDAQTLRSLPAINTASQTSTPVLEAESHTQILNARGRTEEHSLLHLAKAEGEEAPESQGNLNVGDTLSGLGVSLLVTCTNLAKLGNDPSALAPSCAPEVMAKITDKHDGKSSSDHSSQPSLGSQKIPEAVEARTSLLPPPLLAFTNPIHFFQLGPPSPPTTRHRHRPQYISQGPQRQQKADAKIDTVDSAVMRQMAEGAGRLRKGLEKPELEPIPPPLPRKERTAKHPHLEKSTSCPNKSIIQWDTKDPEHNSNKQEGLTKIRTKSKDWHRQGVRKISIPTENAFAEEIASFLPSRGEVLAHKDPSDQPNNALHGEKKSAETVENIKRRHSKLINSSRLLYQEYSDVALNKAIQSQKRADSLSEELELENVGSQSSSRLRRKVLQSQDSCLQRLSISSSASLWQDIPMVRGSTMLLSMTHEEQKLQEAKFELIASEASYLRSLNVAVDHFQHSPELQAALTNQDKQWLFSRLQDVRDVSANFLFDLEEKLEENMFTFNVCDVALKHAPEFRRVYLPYVTNQTYQEQTFQRLLNGLPAFQQVLEKLESDPICQRLSLKSFLILPFQRITRLKLLLQNILKRTQPGADEEVQATQAYDALEKLIKDCNENVQRMKNTEELIHLSQNMVFECKIFPLISQSRRLVKRGELTALEYNLSLKWKLTTRPIYLHLFNDFLLLSRPRENGHFTVFDYAASSEVRGEKCEMKLHGANKNVFRLFLLQNNQGKKVEFLFRTETQSEKLRWISALTPQQAELDLLDDSDAPQVQCVKSYKARENDELALEKADIVMVLRQSTDGWIEGVKLSDGERGWFPSEQVEFISSRHARQMNLKEEQRVKNAKQQVFRRK